MGHGRTDHIFTLAEEDDIDITSSVHCFLLAGSGKKHPQAFNRANDVAVVRATSLHDGRASLPVVAVVRPNTDRSHRIEVSQKLK